jgi:hypothetical protein
MTEPKLMRVYWESVRQEARILLRDLKVHNLAKGGEEVAREIERLNLQAYPPDVEDDGDFDIERAKELKHALTRVGV